MEGVIFDLDGTLLDSMGLWRRAGVIYLERYGIYADESLADIILPLTKAAAARYIKEHYPVPESAENIAEGINGVMEEFYKNYIRPKEGADELLAALHARGIPMSVATATDRYLVQSALDRLGWNRYIRGFFTCGEVGAGKRESAAVYDAALKSFGGTKKGSWVFEDSPHAALTAARAGYNVAGVRDEGGKPNAAELKAACNVYFESLAPAQNVLRALGLNG